MPVKTNSLNPIYRVNASDSFKKIEERIVEKINRLGLGWYAEVAYDEFRLAALTLNNHTGTQQDDIGSLRATFIKHSQYI